MATTAAVGGDFNERRHLAQLDLFLTPDWSDDPEAVPCANLGNPQSLNLYSYVLTNPPAQTVNHVPGPDQRRRPHLRL
ncbi:MAG: hypothetical protein ACREDR_40370 [Blastocatellia bacterium]